MFDILVIGLAGPLMYPDQMFRDRTFSAMPSKNKNGGCSVGNLRGRPTGWRFAMIGRDEEITRYILQR